MSWPGSFRSSSSVAVTSMMSSESWKAIPMARPKSSRMSTVSAGASDSMPPRRQEGAIRVAVLRLVEAAGGVHLPDLSVGEDRDGPGEEPRHVRSELGGDLRGLGEEEVAG